MRYFIISHRDVSSPAKIMVFLTEDQRRAYFETVLYKNRLSDIAEYLLFRLDKFDEYDKSEQKNEQEHEHRTVMKLKQTAIELSKQDYKKCLESSFYYDSHTNIMYSFKDI